MFFFLKVHLRTINSKFVTLFKVSKGLLISRKINKYTWLTRDVFEFEDQTVDDVCENQILLNVSSQQNSTQLGEKVEAAIKVKSNLARRIQVENVVVGFSRKILNKNNIGNSYLNRLREKLIFGSKTSFQVSRFFQEIL
jgi:hypothetical protein